MTYKFSVYFSNTAGEKRRPSMKLRNGLSLRAALDLLCDSYNQDYKTSYKDWQECCKQGSHCFEDLNCYIYKNMAMKVEAETEVPEQTDAEGEEEKGDANEKIGIDEDELIAEIGLCDDISKLQGMYQQAIEKNCTERVISALNARSEILRTTKNHD